MSTHRDEQTQVTARDGRVVRVRSGERGLLLEVARSDRALLTRELRDWSQGGYELTLSPDDRFVALFLWSAQSEVAYQVFELADLRSVAEMPYVHGEGDRPIFATSSDALVMAWSTNPHLALFDPDGDPPPEEARTSLPTNIEWAVVHVRELESGLVREGRVALRVPAGRLLWGEDAAFYPERLHADAEAVAFETGWGRTVVLPRPLQAAHVVDGPPPGFEPAREPVPWTKPR